MRRNRKRVRTLIKFGASAVAWCLLVALGTLGLILLAKAITLLWALLIILLVAFAFGFLDAVAVSLWRRRRKKPAKKFTRLWLRGLVGNGLSVGTLVALLYLGAVFINANLPYSVPRVTLTNGDKQVVFQGMLHIGSGAFYERVIYDMLDAEQQGYDFIFEGYRPGTPENNNRFETVQGQADDVDTYELQTNLADVCGLDYQNDYFRVWREKARMQPDRYAVVDVSVDEMMNEWDRLVRADAALGTVQDKYSAQSGNPQSNVKWSDLFAWIGQLNQDQKEVVALGCQTLLNLLSEYPLPEQDSPFQAKVILDFRNRIVADKILAHSNPKLYVTYGAAHIQGIYKLLRAQDPRWHVQEVQWRQPISIQTQRTGTLDLDD